MKALLEVVALKVNDVITGSGCGEYDPCIGNTCDDLDTDV